MAAKSKVTSPSSLEEFCKLARELGATDAKVVSPRNVVTGTWVRWKCQYGCSEYGRHLTCPPYSPTPEQTRKVLDEYKSAILLRGERTAPLRDIGAELELRIFLAGYYKAFGFGAGPCNLCRDCNLERCRHPEKARPAMEAAGIDVFQTARKAGFPIKVVNSSESQPNYYGLVLVE